MPSSMLKATTALTVSISLLQPGPLAAQGFAAMGQQSEARGGIFGHAPQERLWQVQTCAENPTLPECPTDSTVAPDADGAVAPAIDPQPEVAPEPEGAPEPSVVPDNAPDQISDPAETPETAAEPVVEPVVEPSGDADLPPTTAEELPAATEAAPAIEPEAAPSPDPDQAQAPSVAPAADDVSEPNEITAPDPATEGSDGETLAAPDAPDVAAPANEPELSKDAATGEAAGVATEAPAGASVLDAPLPEQPVAPEAAQAPEPTVKAAPALELADEPASEPVDASDAEVIPEPTAEDVAVVKEMMANPEVAAAVDTLAETLAPPVETAATADPTLAVSSGLEAVLAAAGAKGTIPVPAATTTQTLNAAESRTSTQDFTSRLFTTAQPAADKDDDKLSDLEKAGLFALGAVVVGMVIANNRVVANSGDRVVVDRGDGNLAIWKDDNANLRAPGIVETTDRFKDGSTLTTLNRPDGSQIITIRDATGRVLRRDRVNPNGTRVPLIDDTRPYSPVQVSTLPRPRIPELRLADTTDVTLLRALLSEAEQPEIGRTFSLAQVRDIQELRALAPELSGDPITFATGSSAIRPEEAGKLARIGQLMTEMIADNPSELFLVEGHTDAVGSAAYNLALSDRRAESVALALTEIFGVPAENMVIQGYGERFLKVPTAGDEPRNRRVALRRITWLIDG